MKFSEWKRDMKGTQNYHKNIIIITRGTLMGHEKESNSCHVYEKSHSTYCNTG